MKEEEIRPLEEEILAALEDLVPTNFTAGDYVIVTMTYNFGTKKEYLKKFVSYIIRTNSGRNESQYEVSFLWKQHSLNADNDEEFDFVYPERILGKWLVNETDIVKKLNQL